MKKLFLAVLFIILMFSTVSARYIRVNQVGYLPPDAKNANLFSSENLSALSFSVYKKSDNTRVLGPLSVGTNLGAYSGYNYHYRLNFTALNAEGTYYIRLSDGITDSPDFAVGACAYLTAPDAILNFLRSQRCGYNPYLNASCHLHTGTTRLDAKAVGGPQNGAALDVSGGWHDAGDYIKFMINIANVTYLLLLAYDENPGVFEDAYKADGTAGTNGIPDVLDEAKYGLDFIIRMHPSANEFYHQVGDAVDHDTWRLPNNDAAAYPQSPYRPVYHCDTGKGANVAGKAAAALALASSIYASRGDTSYALTCRTHAEQLYTFGKANQAAQSSVPTDFYDDTTWQDDMELAAAELYKLTGTSTYLTDAETWAPAVSSAWGWTSWGVMNFYAHYALYNSASAGLKTQLKQFMQYDMNGNQTYAAADHFGIGADYIWGSMALNTAGILNGLLYKKLFNETTYDSLVTGMRDYLLGRNQWGVSFIVGIGSDYPNNSHHQVAGLLNADITGMTIEGPVSQAEWNNYGAVKPAPAADPYNSFQSSEAVYYDYEGDYSTNEPTIWQAGLTLAMMSFYPQAACFGTATHTPTSTYTVTPGGPTFTHTYTATATSTAMPTATMPSGTMIDGFEDNELLTNHLGGGWYEFADPASSSVSRAVINTNLAPGAGSYAMLLSGSVAGPVDSWASIGAGTNINAAGTAADVSANTGIRVYIKGNKGTGTNVDFRIQLITDNITDYSYWSHSITAVPSDWTLVNIPWTAFAKPGWGEGAALTLAQVLSRVVSIQFSIADTTGAVAANSGNNWYIDSIELYGGISVTNTPTSTPASGTATPTPTASVEAAKCKRMLAYYPYWVSGYKADKIPYSKLTHICHAFVQPQPDGSITAPSGFMEPALITLAHAAGVKVLVSIGGADETARQNFVTIAASSALRTAFAQNVENFCRTYGYDGADIDWEFPQDAGQRTNQNLLIQAVRDRFDATAAPAPSWQITMAVSPGNWYGQWNDYAYLNNVIDFYNLMNYDYHGSWSAHSGHNAALYRGTDPTDGENIDWSHTYMTVTRGVPASKLNLGLAFYGYRFPSSENLYDNCGGNCASAVQINYKDIPALIGAGWTKYQDAGSHVPYLRNDAGAGLITYDDPASITEKVNYALETKGYGGVFMWEITGDYNAGSMPLMDAMYNAYSAHCGTVATATYTATHTSTYTSTNTATATNTSSAVNTSTNTNTYTPTNTATRTNSATATFTPSETVTTGGPTFTFTNTYTNTHTAVATNTATNTFTAINTATNTSSPVNTATNTSSPVNTATNTSSPVNTATNTSSPVNTATNTSSPVNTATNTNTLTGTATQTFTNTRTYTFTQTQTPAFPTSTHTRTNTQTFTTTRTHTFTHTFTATPTHTFTHTFTNTYTPTYTATTVPSFTYTPTPTATPIPSDSKEQEIKDIILFPHPYDSASGSLKIKYTTTKRSSEITIKIYSSAFRLIKQVSLGKNIYSGVHVGEVKASQIKQLANGTYYFVIMDSEGARSKADKIIILK